MNPRELFQSIMHYGEFDRLPVVHLGEWKETRERWRAEGLPADREPLEALGAAPPWVSPLEGDGWLGVGAPGDLLQIGIFPPFAEEVREQTPEYRVVRGADGVIRKEWKTRSGIPHYLGYSLRTAADWERYKGRLQPDPARIAPGLEERLAALERSGLPLCFPAGSLMGWVRNWMGVENLAYLCHDEPEVFADMVQTIAGLSCWLMDRILPRHRVDLAQSWEDICGRSGPLVSPEIFRRCVAPGYRRIRAKLEEHGVDLYGVDSDGDVSALAGLWLEAGVNLLYPLEVGSFGGDARAHRKRYGKALRLVGGFDKLCLEKGRAAIQAELDLLLPLMKEGGYIPAADHQITPGVPLADYRWYLEQVRSLRL
jgi:uroporphyrinogen decarboxylase